MVRERRTAAPELPPTTERRPTLGKASLDALYRGVRQAGRPLLFLDFDDVICLSKPYGGYDVFQQEADQPPDLWDRLWHPPAAEVLLSVVRDWRPQIVITTSWLRFMERAGFEALFCRTGLTAVAEALHDVWEAPQDQGRTRFQAIERWLHANYVGQRLVVFDDELSGTGLRGSTLHKAGYVVLCQVGVGLHAGHLPDIRKALATAEAKD